MKEILFRGRDIATGQWVYGDFSRPCNICFAQTDENGEEDWNDCAVVPYTVGQFIGLTDRRGTRIFEGDVVRHRLEMPGRDASALGTVRWNAELCRFYRDTDGGPVTLSAAVTAFYEVVGNIYDDPTLLEKVVTENA